MFSLKEIALDLERHKASKQAAVPLVQLVEVEMQRYGLKVDSPEQAVRLIWAAIHGLAVLLMDEQLPHVTQTPGEITVHAAATARILHDGLFLAAK